LFLLIQIFRKYRPDIVHTHTPKAGLLGMLAAYLCGVPVKIHTVAGLPWINYRGLAKYFMIQLNLCTGSGDKLKPNLIISKQITINNKKYNLSGFIMHQGENTTSIHYLFYKILYMKYHQL
jgi:UDP-N-acetylglucosamine:LPS N-acetylglucosamine transferase